MVSKISHIVRRTQAGEPLFYGWFEAMHSRMDLLLVGVDEQRGVELAELVYEMVSGLDRQVNRFDPQSDVAKINANQLNLTFALDPQLVDIFAQAERFGVLTNRLFDVAIQTPDYHIGNEYFHVDATRGELRVESPRVIFDFGGFAKGYALEMVNNFIALQGIENGLISFGNSSVCAFGRPSADQLWSVAVENPYKIGETVKTVELHNCSLSTSGNSAGKSPHIKSVANPDGEMGQRLVSVVAGSALEGEVFSTALFAAGEGDIAQAIINNGVTIRQVMFVDLVAPE